MAVMAARIPYLVRSNLKGSSYSKAPPVRIPRAAGGMGVRGGMVGGARGSRNPVDAGFGDENQRGSFHYIGPFSWGGHLTAGAQAARAAHSTSQAAISKFYSDVQSNFTNSGSMHGAFLGALKSNPGIAGTAARLGISPVQLFQAAQRGPTVNDLQTRDLGNGLTATMGPGGKWTISRQEQPRAAARPQKPTIVKTGTGYGYVDSAHPGIIQPMTGPQGQAISGPAPKPPAPPKPPVSKEESAGDQRLVNAYGTIMQTLDTLKATVGATGSFGWGAANRAIAMHTPLSGPQGEAYNEAYNTLLKASLASAGSTRLKAVLEAAVNTLPKPGNATAFNVNQAIPVLGMQTRTQIANLDAQLRHSGSYDTTAIDTLARNYDAGPALMNQVNSSLAALAAAPGQMTPQQLGPLVQMMKKGDLPQDVGERVLRQMFQRGVLQPQQWKQLTTDYPDLNQISPQERTDPRFIPQQPGANAPGGTPAPTPPGTTPPNGAPPPAQPNPQTHAPTPAGGAGAPGTGLPPSPLPGPDQSAPPLPLRDPGALGSGTGPAGPANPTTGALPAGAMIPGASMPKPATGPSPSLVQGGALGPQSAAQPRPGPIQGANANSLDQNLQNYQMQMAQASAPNGQPLPNNSGSMAGQSPTGSGQPNAKMAALAAASQLSQEAGTATGTGVG